MRKRSWKSKAVIGIAGLLLVLTGCQPAGGLDINKALMEAAFTPSLEGKADFSLELVPDGQASGDPQQAAQLKLLQHASLHLESIRIENEERLSATGYVNLASYHIPFRTYMDEQQLVIAVEGGKTPIVFKLEPDADNPFAGPFKELSEKLPGEQLAKSIISYLIERLPNPGKLNVSSVNEQINGQSESLYRLQTEMTGKELMPLIKAFVLNIMKDDAALKALVGQLYDAVAPIIKAELLKAPGLLVPPTPLPVIEKTTAFYSRGLAPALETSSSHGAGALLPEEAAPAPENAYDAGEPDATAPYTEDTYNGDGMNAPLEDYYASPVAEAMQQLLAVFDDREAAIEIIHTEIKQVMVFLLIGLNSAETGVAADERALLFDERTKMNASLYFDRALKLRKSTLSLEATPQSPTTDGISSIRFTATAESWNVGGKVAAVPIELPAGSAEWSDETRKADILNHFAPESDMFRLLKDDLQITKRTAYMYVDDEAGEGMYSPWMAYIDNDIAMAPARDLAEQLQLEVRWNEEARSLTLTDPSTIRSVTVQADSAAAIVDGRQATMPAEARIKDDILFVPAGFIAQQLGGITQWNDEERTFTITLP